MDESLVADKLVGWIVEAGQVRLSGIAEIFLKTWSEAEALACLH
jgi:hypothetical protein